MKTQASFAAIVACFLVLAGIGSLQAQSFPPALKIDGVGIFQQTTVSGSSANYPGFISNGTGGSNYSIALLYSGPGGSLSNYSVSMDVDSYNSDTGESSSSHYDLSYNPATNTFELPGWTVSPVHSNGVPWVPPPNNATFGPPRIWVNGTIYSWSDSSFIDSDFSHGTDHYTGDVSRWVHLTFTPGDDPQYTVSGTAPDGSTITGAYTAGFFDVSGADVRAMGASTGVLYPAAPGSLPPAIRFGAPSPVWRYLGTSTGRMTLGYSGTRYHYAGANSGERLVIDAGSRVGWLVADNTFVQIGIYADGVIWTRSPDQVRAVEANGARIAPATAPAYGPVGVWVNRTLWRFAGTWNYAAAPATDFNLSTFPNPPSAVADYYVGSNAGQLLWIDSSRAVHLTNLDGASGTGTYDASSSTFDVSGFDVFAATAEGTSTTRINGPPSVWVNGILFDFSDAEDGVDNYDNGTGEMIEIGSTWAAGLDAEGRVLWQGSYDAGTSAFSITSVAAWQFDVRAYSGASPVLTGSHPLSGHPYAVKLDGEFLSFAGTLDTDGKDYYVGPTNHQGERLTIDSAGQVVFWLGNATPAPAGSGFLSGTVFVVSGHDLRACNVDHSPMPPSPAGTISGVARVWVNGVVWNRLGMVDDNARSTHADYYGGPNAGNLLTINPAGAVALRSPEDSGTYGNGVFLMNGNNDVRVADGAGHLVHPYLGSAAPAQLRIGGLHWQPIGYRADSSGQRTDYYAAAETGQRLSIGPGGAVTYSDRTNGVFNATGTYANGSYTPISGGGTFATGTVSSDLDILGNVLSLGSLADDHNTAGLTLSFRDDTSHSPPTATIGLTASRPLAHWLWARTSSPDPNANTVLMMQLDSTHRLSLFDPADATQPAAIVLDPGSGTSTFRGPVQFKGPVRVLPQGDIGMGEFTYSPW